jgi:hypothetical protein
MGRLISLMIAPVTGGATRATGSSSRSSRSPTSRRWSVRPTAPFAYEGTAVVAGPRATAFVEQRPGQVGPGEVTTSRCHPASQRVEPVGVRFPASRLDQSACSERVIFRAILVEALDRSCPHWKASRCVRRIRRHRPLHELAAHHGSRAHPCLPPEADGGASWAGEGAGSPRGFRRGGREG